MNTKTQNVPQIVFNTVCEHFAIKKSAMMSRLRTDHVATGRMLIVYLSREEGVINNEICHFLKLNHATGIYAVKAITARMDVDAKFRREVSIVNQKLEKQLGRKFKFGGNLPLRREVKVKSVARKNGGFWVQFEAAPTELQLVPGASIIIEEMEII